MALLIMLTRFAIAYSVADVLVTHWRDVFHPPRAHIAHALVTFDRHKIVVSAFPSATRGTLAAFWITAFRANHGVTSISWFFFFVLTGPIYRASLFALLLWAF
jgi:hypothetical protein